MDVWLVFQDCEIGIKGVFSSEEKAQAYIDKRRYPREYFIREYAVDAGSQMTSPETREPPFCASGKKKCDHPDWCAEQDQCWHDAHAADELMDCYQYGTVPSPATADAELVELIMRVPINLATSGISMEDARKILTTIRPLIEEQARQSERQMATGEFIEVARRGGIFMPVILEIAACLRRSRSPAPGEAQT